MAIYRMRNVSQRLYEENMHVEEKPLPYPTTLNPYFGTSPRNDYQPRFLKIPLDFGVAKDSILIVR